MVFAVDGADAPSKCCTRSIATCFRRIGPPPASSAAHSLWSSPGYDVLFILYHLINRTRVDFGLVVHIQRLPWFRSKSALWHRPSTAS
jgi:hypothetical protein